MTTVEDYDKERLKIRGEQYVRKESEINNGQQRSKRINWRQFFIICSILISAYLVNGEHAQTVCNICTTVPAAIFTYGQLSDHTTRIFAYKATLFYWSIHGILIAFDSIFMDAFGYFFGKFILLIILFFNVIYQYDIAKNSKNLLETEHHQKQHNIIANKSIISSTKPSSSSSSPINLQFSPYGSQFGLNTAMTITDVTQFSGQHPFKNDNRYSSLVTAYSVAHSPDMTAYLDTSYTHDGSLKTVTSSDEQYKFESQKQRQIVLDEDSSILSDSDNENDEKSESVNDDDNNDNHGVKSIPAGDCKKANDETGESLHASEEYSTSYMTKEADETLIISPNEYIVFKHPFTETVTIYVKNKHSRPIMWALKTNAIKRMIAQPTCGTLGKDATVHIKIGVTEVPSEESNMNDRIAIDYCLIDDDTIGFDRSFLYNAEDPFRRRKKFNIYYEN
ncbi:Major sperm protein [Dirofilaria immitis]